MVNTYASQYRAFIYNFNELLEGIPVDTGGREFSPVSIGLNEHKTRIQNTMIYKVYKFGFTSF